MTNVLILETYAERYASDLRPAFATIRVHAARNVEEADIALSEVDVLIAFGIAVDDGIVRQATRLKWIQSLATGVDHSLRCPSLKPETLLTSGRGIQGPAMRETVAFHRIRGLRHANRAGKHAALPDRPARRHAQHGPALKALPNQRRGAT